MYRLVGIVIHSGQAQAGHYYSIVKDRRQDNSFYNLFSYACLGRFRQAHC